MSIPHFDPSASSFVVPITPHSPLEPQSGFPSPNLSLPGSFNASPGVSSARSYRHSALLEGGKYHEDWTTARGNSATGTQATQQQQASLSPYSSPPTLHGHRQTRSVGRVPSLNHLQQQQRTPGVNHRASMMIPPSNSFGGGSSDNHSNHQGLSSLDTLPDQ